MATTESVPPDFEPMVSEREVQLLFGVSQQTLRNWSNQGLLRRVKVNQRVGRYFRADVQALIDGHDTASPDAGA